jgi:hypothetical protein
MFPINYFWNDSKTTATATLTDKPRQPLTTSTKDQSETQTSSFLKIRELLSSEDKQVEIARQRQQVLGFDSRDS